MAERRALSVRVRTSLAAVVVVAVALLAGGVLLLLVVRDSMHDGVESTAETRAEQIAQQVQAAGLSADDRDDDDGDDDDGPPPAPGFGGLEDQLDHEVGDVVWQITDSAGRVELSSAPLRDPLPRDDADSFHVADADHDYLVAVEDAGDLRVAVGVSREPIDDATAALVGPLGVGLPVLLLLVGGTTWMVATRALAPVTRIRREVDRITAESLERRVPDPGSRDEIGLLAATMNRMLARLQSSGEKQRRFVADASHELRSPLATIRQTAEVARAHPDALPPSELTDTVLGEAERMQRLVEQLLLLARSDNRVSARPDRDVDLDDLLLTEASRAMADGLEVDLDGVRPTRVRADEVALGQVVRNLVDNARRHARSRLTLSAAPVAEGQVQFAVADDGIGIPVEDRDRIFERFVRLDEARSRDAGGSGLGLAIVAEIVTRHGGSVRVVDAHPHGARFEVTLPTGAPPRP